MRTCSPSEFVRRWPGSLRPVVFPDPPPALPADCRRLLTEFGLPRELTIYCYNDLTLKFSRSATPLATIGEWDLKRGYKMGDMPGEWTRFWHLADQEYLQGGGRICIEELTGRLVVIDLDCPNPIYLLNSSVRNFYTTLAHFLEWSEKTDGSPQETMILREALRRQECVPAKELEPFWMNFSGGPCIREIRLWDLTSGKQTAALPGHDEYGVKAMAFQRDGKTLVSVGHDARIKLWDVATGKNTATLKTAGWTPAAAFGPDGKTVATAVWVVESIKGRNVVTDNSVRLWEVATGKEQVALQAVFVSSLVFSPDGKTLATGSEDGTMKLWEVATGKELATLRGHTDKVLSLAYSADGKILASGSADKTIKLWDLSKTR